MSGVPFDPSLMDRFMAAARTSMSRMGDGSMTDWLALRWGIDADGLIVYSHHYAQTMKETRPMDAEPAELVNAFVAGFSIALELVTSREAAKS